MGDLIDDLVDHVGKLVDDKGGAWLDRGLASAEALIDERTKQVAPGSFESEMMAEALLGLTVVKAHAPTLTSYGKARAAGVLVHLSTGNLLSARRVALDRSTSFAERRQASAESTAAVHASVDADEKAHDEMVAMAKEIGLGALKAALPFILAAL